MHLQPPPFVPQLKSVDDTAYFDPSEHLLRSFSDAPEGDGAAESAAGGGRISIEHLVHLSQQSLPSKVTMASRSAAWFSPRATPGTGPP